MVVAYIKPKYLLLIFFVITIITAIVSGCSTSTKDMNTANTTRAATVVWQNTYGGPGYDSGNAVIRTNDGGYAITGSMTIVRDNETSFYNVSKMFLVKTDSSGKELWNQTYGDGLGNGYSAVQTSDGGYAILGYSNSDSNAIYLVRTDANGHEIWNTTYGGYQNCITRSLAQTSEGGYLITGGTGRTLIELNVLLIKIDANGHMVWNKTFESGYGNSVMPLADGGYAIAASAFVQPYIIRTDTRGNELWNKTYSPAPLTTSQTTSTSNSLSSAVQTSDGGYVVSGTTVNYSTAVNSSNGTTINIASQLFLIKTDDEGTQQWSRTYDSPGTYQGFSVVQADDDGYVILGCGNNITSINIKTMNLSTMVISKLYLVKTDKSGNEVWNTTYGGDAIYKVSSMVKSGDGGYVITGSKSRYILGDQDIFLVKIA